MYSKTIFVFRAGSTASFRTGVDNSAYFEHTLLARLMGVDFVEGRDLFCSGRTSHTWRSERFAPSVSLRGTSPWATVGTATTWHPCGRLRRSVRIEAS